MSDRATQKPTSWCQGLVAGAARRLRATAWVLALCLTVGALASRCAGTDIGNPSGHPTDVTVGFAAYEQSAPGGLLLDSGVTLDEAWIGVEAIRIQSADECEADPTVDVPGLHAVDLLRGQSFPPLPTFQRQSGPYCQLELRFAVLDAAALPAEAPAALADQSFLARGLRVDGVPFVLTAALEDTLVLAGVDGTFPITAPRTDLIVGFELNAWFASGLLDTVTGLLRLELDPGSHPEMVASFLEGVVGSARLFEDADHDGVLDPEEIAEPLAVTR